MTMTSEKKIIDRRTFLKVTGIGGASMALSDGFGGKALAAEGAGDSISKKMPKRVFGKTGVPVSILALGGITDWTINQALLKIAFNMGVTYWDTAYGYGNGKSEIGIGQYLEKYPEDRKTIFLVTKSHESNPEALTKSLDVSLERMKTDYVDLFFLHGLTSADLLTQEIKAWVEQKKKEGKIKFFGYSVHLNNSQILVQTSALGWIDAIMPTYNYRTMINDDINRGIEACAKAGIGLTAMKVMGMRFTAAETPEELKVTNSFMEKGYTLEQAKLKALWKDERIASCCVAMYNLTVLKDNVAAATDGRQLSGREIEILRRYAENTRSQYCQGCMKCASVMGADSRIHDVLRYMMYYNSYGDRDRAREEFRMLPEYVTNGLASRDYSPAERVCPNRIEIGRAMREAARILA
jgi:predicted aldo/keto reductase-like oxidoreductase